MRVTTWNWRPGKIGALLAVIVAASACGGVDQSARVSQSAPVTTAASPRATDVADTDVADTAPTQMWIDDDGHAGRIVIVRSGRKVASYDATTLAPRWRSDAAVLSADRRTAVTAAPASSGTGTTLTVVDIATGATKRTIELAQPREAVAVSTDGTRVALVDPLTLDPTTAMPVGREVSTVDVVDLVTGATVTSQRLEGNFVPEAFDASGGVAIIEYVPAAKPERYRVRTLDLKSGRVSNVLTRDKTEIVDEMQGYGRAAVSARDGAALFTLYRDGGRWGSAFIHQLVGQGQFAFCIDLPEVGFDDASALALSPDERLLYVAGAKGAVAVIDATVTWGIEPVAVQKMLWVPGVVGTASAIAVTTDTVWLLVDGHLVSANRTTGEHIATQPAPGASSVGVSADGAVRVVADSAGVRQV